MENKSIIIELAEKSGSTHKQNLGVYQFYEDELSRFAELIIQECILTIQMGITRDGHNTEKYLRSIKHIEQIKEHFGVEK